MWYAGGNLTGGISFRLAPGAVLPRVVLPDQLVGAIVGVGGDIAL